MVLGTALLVACGETPEEKRARIYELRKSGDADDVEEIRRQLDDPDEEVRATALFGLVQLGVEDAADLALAGLEDEHRFVRKIAAASLGSLGERPAVPVLAEHLLSDPEPTVRGAAAEAMLEIGGEEIVDPLIQALEDPIKEVRLVAVRGVTREAPERAVDMLASLLLGDPDWEIRVQAAAGIGRSGRPDLLPVLDEAANDPNEFVRAAVARARAEVTAAAEDRAAVVY